jgi:hypothetical protein
VSSQADTAKASNQNEQARRYGTRSFWARPWTLCNPSSVFDAKPIAIRGACPILGGVQTSDVVLGLLVLAALAFQVWVTIKVRRSEDYDAGQKSAQMKLIWLLPIVGAVVAFSVMENDTPREPPDREQRG